MSPALGASVNQEDLTHVNRERKRECQNITKSNSASKMTLIVGVVSLVTLAAFTILNLIKP